MYLKKYLADDILNNILELECRVHDFSFAIYQ